MTAIHNIESDTRDNDPDWGGVVPPDPEAALAWAEAPAEGPGQLAVVGCHGGAGVDTLAALIEGLVPMGQQWPIGDGEQPPLPVLLVARASLRGLEAAHLVLRQWRTGGAPAGTELAGLVLVAASARKRGQSEAVAIKRRLVSGLAPAVTDVRWHEDLLGLPLEDLPTWRADSPDAHRAKKLTAGITSDIAALGLALTDWLDPEPHSAGETTDPALDAETGGDGDDDLLGGESVPAAAAVPDGEEAPPASRRRALPELPAYPGTFRASKGPVPDDRPTEPIPVVPPTPAGSHTRDLPAQSPDHAGPTSPAVISRTSGTRRRDKVIMAGAGVAAVSVIVGAGVWIASAVSGGDEAPVAVPDPSVSAAADSSATAAPVDPCPASVKGPVTTGNGPGDQMSGPGAILAWNHGYYTLRDAKAARKVTAAGAVAEEPEVQAAIDKVPADSSYCVRITDRGPDTWAVELTETPREGVPIIYRQIVRTTQTAGKTWITSITTAPQI